MVEMIAQQHMNTIAPMQEDAGLQYLAQLVGNQLSQYNPSLGVSAAPAHVSPQQTQQTQQPAPQPAPQQIAEAANTARGTTPLFAAPQPVSQQAPPAQPTSLSEAIRQKRLQKLGT